MTKALLASAAAAIACSVGLAAAAATLQAGAQVSDCLSALIVGVERCRAPATPVVAAAGDRRRIPNPLESEVDRFLADYGKPSREVARALLDPTDDHVRAMLRSEERRLAIAAFVGSRLTALRERTEADAGMEGPPWPVDASALRAMVRMRASLFTAPADADGWRAARELERVAAAFGALDARVVWIADLDPRDAAVAAAEHGLTLPIRVAAPRTEVVPAPYLLLQDERFGLGRRLAARGLTGKRIRAAIVDLRERGRERGTARGAQ